MKYFLSFPTNALNWAKSRAIQPANQDARLSIPREKGFMLMPGGGTPHKKGVGMLVVPLRGVNFGFWSHLGCSGQNAIIFSREGLV